MKEENNNIIITNLIIKELFDELSVNEKEILYRWIEEKEGNKIVYSQIRQSANYQSWKQLKTNTDIEADWNVILRSIQKNKNRKIRLSILKYAAVFLFLIGIGSGIYFITGKKEIQLISQVNQNVEQIKPGSPKAVLILNDGKQIDLDLSSEKIINEADGTQINNAGGMVRYTKPVVSVALQPLRNTIITPRGGEYNLVLSDGSKVFLNSMSQIRYPVAFANDKREIELSGEAYFEVAKDISKPFIVKVRGMAVEVLGTSFNINAYESSNKVITTLIEGSVEIQTDNSANPSTILNPSEQAVFDILAGKTEIRKVDVSLFTGWKDGKLSFQDATLGEIMEVLSRWYSFNALYRNPGIKEIKTSGNLDKKEDISEFLDIIESTGKIDIIINQDNIVFSEKK